MRDRVDSVHFDLLGSSGPVSLDCWCWLTFWYRGVYPSFAALLPDHFSSSLLYVSGDTHPVQSYSHTARVTNSPLFAQNFLCLEIRALCFGNHICSGQTRMVGHFTYYLPPRPYSTYYLLYVCKLSTVECGSSGFRLNVNG